MGTNPNTDFYTIPGGIKLYFDDGSGYRDLGNIVEIDMEPGADQLDHFCNRSGKRIKDKNIVIEEKLTFNFTLDEVNIENMKLFFRGGDISNIGAGTAAVVNNKVTVNGIKFVSLGDYYGLSAVSVRQFLDYCFMYDNSAVGYVDYSTEADVSAGTPIPGIVENGDILYLGKDTQFQEIYLDFAVNGSYGAVIWRYWNGAAWTVVTVGGAATALAADGKATWTLPADWEKNEVNGTEAYWLQIYATTPWTTPATINHIRQACVLNTDYVLDIGEAADEGRKAGRVARVAAAMLAPDEEIMISFTYTTWTSQKMAIAGVGFIEGGAKLEVWPAAGRGERFDAVFGKVNLKAKGGIKFDDKDWMKVPMTMEVLDDSTNNPSYPLGYFQAYGPA